MGKERAPFDGTVLVEVKSRFRRPCKDAYHSNGLANVLADACEFLLTINKQCIDENMYIDRKYIRSTRMRSFPMAAILNLAVHFLTGFYSISSTYT